MSEFSEIVSAIQSAIPDAEVHILDPMNDGVHLHALVVSEQFEGLTLVKQHQQVMLALQSHFDSTELHALGLKTFTPAKWLEQKHQYPINV